MELPERQGKARALSNLSLPLRRLFEHIEGYILVFRDI
jgi:hypothetical protein